MNLHIKDKDPTLDQDQPSTSKKCSEVCKTNSEISDTIEKAEVCKSNSEISDTTEKLDKSSIGKSQSALSKVSSLSKTEDKKDIVVAKMNSERSRKRKRPVKKQNTKDRSIKRRKLSKRRPKSKTNQRKILRYETSSSTIYTKPSSVSSTSVSCKHCGHRCCKRNRKTDDYRHSNAKSGRANKKRNISADSKKVQAGSRCKMLSPLFVTTNEDLSSNNIKGHQKSYSEVTTEMIFEALSVLGKWRQSVRIEDICSFLLRTYPVNRDRTELLKELKAKLQTALKQDLIETTDNNKWMLKSSLTQLQKTHVTKFWEIYGDTMTPISRDHNRNPENKEETATSNSINLLKSEQEHLNII